MQTKLVAVDRKKPIHPYFCFPLSTEREDSWRLIHSNWNLIHMNRDCIASFYFVRNKNSLEMISFPSMWNFDAGL